jgi:predicted phosphohydrolase
MKVWALGDLHLSFGVPNKQMDVFGPAWADHADRIEAHWKALIGPEDLVLIPGDISWAMKVEEAAVDLQWIHALPGTKVLIKGNHDYWWGSLNKLVPFLPPSIHLLQNSAFYWKGIAIGGARLWDTSEYSFGSWIAFRDNPREKKKEEIVQEDLNEKIFVRELQRLEMSLAQLHPEATHRIAMTHYPPVGPDMNPSRASAILERHQIDTCVFGHLHAIQEKGLLFGEARGVRYLLTSADYLEFKPIAIL